MLDLQSPVTTSDQTTHLLPQALEAFFNALQKYPDFIDGLSAGQLAYHECFGKGPLTHQEILGDINEVFSRSNLENFTLDLEAFGEHMDNPHFYLLGMVLGEIAEGIQA